MRHRSDPRNNILTSTFRYIQFKEVLEFTPRSNAAVFFGFIGTLTYKCNYKAQTSTGDSNVAVIVTSSTTEVESFVNWDGSMDIGFFTDSNGFKNSKL